MVSKAQLRANRKYKRKHRLQNRRNSYKSTCKNYILNWSTRKDIGHDIPQWISIRKRRLKK